MGIPDCSELLMDTSKILFDPTVFFKTRLDEKPFIKAVAVWRSESNRQSPKEIEESHALPRNSFLAYVKWKNEPEPELPQTMRKPPGGAAAKPIPLQLASEFPPATVPIDAAAAVSETERKTLLKLASNDSVWSDNLYAAAKLAIEMQHQETITLWKASCQVAKLGEYAHQQRAIFECARRIAENPGYYPSQTQGGVKSCANDPIFVEFLAQAVKTRDTTALNCLYGEDLMKFFQEQHHKFYHKNAAANVEELSKSCCKKLRKQIRLTSNALNFASSRRLAAMGDPRNFIAFYVGAVLTFQDVALDLRFNWDETSLLVCADARSGTNKFLGLAWTTEEMMQVLKTLNRSPAGQSKTLAFTPRMVQWGCLAASDGRLHLLIKKIYDRSIDKKHNLKWVKLPQPVNGCDIIIMFIRGKQLGPGAAIPAGKEVKEAAPTKATKEKAEAEAREKLLQEIDHGGLDKSHSSEKEVAELTMTLVARKIAEVKLKYEADLRKFKEQGFECGTHSDLYSKPAASQATASADASNASDVCDDDCSESASGDESDENDEIDGYNGDGTITSEEDCCPHLPASCTTKLHKCALSKKQSSGAPWTCSICEFEGRGPLYSCVECNFFAHPSCCLPRDKATEAVRSTTNVVRQMAAALGHESVECRAALSLDGAVGQSSALEGTAENPGIIEREFLPIGCDVLKGSAQLSLSENPLDLMRSFMGIKRCKVKWTMQNGRPSKFMQAFIDGDFKEIMRNASASDQRTFILSLSHVERCISKHFTMDAVQSGWEKAGLIDLSFHTIMSHFLEWRQMPLENIQGVQACLPAFFHEMAAGFELSDQTMAMMQRFFPVDFQVYPTGRETLSISRKRCTIFSRWLQLRRKIALKFEADNPEPAPFGDEELQPTNPKLALTGKAICPCALKDFHGRHYENTPEGWQLHVQTSMHQKWRRAELEKLLEGESERQVAATAHALPWFAQESCSKLQYVFENLNLNAALGKRFVKAKITDADIPMMMVMTDDRWMQDFGMQPGQVHQFKSVARNHAESPDCWPFEDAIWMQNHAWNHCIECLEERHSHPTLQNWTDDEAQEKIAELRMWIDCSTRSLRDKALEMLQYDDGEPYCDYDALGDGYNGGHADAGVEELLETDAVIAAEDAKKRKAKRKRAKNRY